MAIIWSSVVAFQEILVLSNVWLSNLMQAAGTPETLLSHAYRIKLITFALSSFYCNSRLLEVINPVELILWFRTSAKC